MVCGYKGGEHGVCQCYRLTIVEQQVGRNENCREVRTLYDPILKYDPNLYLQTGAERKIATHQLPREQ